MSVADAFRLDGKIAVINGAGRGIGAATAMALAELGADVAVLSRTKEQIDGVAAQITALGRRAVAIQCDARDKDAVNAAISSAADQLGGIDIAVNVVGGSMPNAFMSTSERALAESYDNNVLTGLRFAKAAIPHLLSRGGGSITLVSSAVGHLVGRGYVAYGSAKAAVDHATRLLAAELSPRIRVNAVAPGAILTEALEVVASDPAIKKALEDGTPLRRLGMPDDIAAAVCFLSSPAASYITGQILAVDGGLIKPNLDIPFPDL